VELYYFSGTGNSLHVAKELQKRIPKTKLIPMISLLDKKIIKAGSNSIGFVFPTYLTMVPVPVRKFIDILQPDKANYIFSITTRIGSATFANIYIDRMLRKKGKSVDAAFVLNMGNNSPAGLKPIADKNWEKSIGKEKIKKLENAVQKELDIIKSILEKEEKYPVKKNIINILMERLMNSLTAGIKKEIPFYADSSCAGCGLCEKVCTSGKIKIIRKKPVWKKKTKCYYCYACFNYCPEESILIKNLYLKKNGRYSHPSVKAKDIAGQKILKIKKR
jgi:NAD-dependent dihydropyrimidine dehydrogenase PreA subunit/flavodoxin